MSTITDTLSLPMHNPPHPGEVLRELCLEPLKLSVTAAARALGVSRKTLSELLNGKAGVSPVMAIRLGKAFNTTPESWLAQQMAYDLWMARRLHAKIKVRPLAA
jgi:addiction module HigA family antidote